MPRLAGRPRQPRSSKAWRMQTPFTADDVTLICSTVENLPLDALCSPGIAEFGIGSAGGRSPRFHSPTPDLGLTSHFFPVQLGSILLVGIMLWSTETAKGKSRATANTTGITIRTSRS
jgi:hypothetical protein